MKKLWGRKISDLSFSSFIKKIQYLAKKEGKIIQFVDRFYASSKTCFDCKFYYKDLQIKDREWNCPSCGSVHERDLNASFNILEEGIRLFEESSGRALSDIVPGLRPLFGGSHWNTVESHLL
jgi:putative transposase